MTVMRSFEIMKWKWNSKERPYVQLGGASQFEFVLKGGFVFLAGAPSLTGRESRSVGSNCPSLLHPPGGPDMFVRASNRRAICMFVRASNRRAICITIVPVAY